jgi:hypothetical protein
MSELEGLRRKVSFLRREKTEYYRSATVAEAIDVLIECCDFMLNIVEEVQVED